MSPGGCDKDGPGEINVPISCGSAVVAPGDISSAMAMGSRSSRARTPRKFSARRELVREEKRIAEIQAGKVFRADVDELLRKHGVIA